ncbi:MAG: histidinol-phosphatase HisJ family protein [Phycisphaerales bacterium]|nr:histidinol-phosphatase HisJ family protein [Phycisphaerales bacterium]
MRLYDQHLHTWNSFDCKTPPEQNVAEALEKGLAGLTFTDHFDTHPSEWPECKYDDAKIAREIDALRDRFGDRIFIGKGIEVCYQPERMDFILEFLAKHTFDVVLLSVHWAHGKPVHVREHFDGMDPHTFIHDYLTAARDATAHIAHMQEHGGHPFHILGHMDFAKRYANRYWGFDEPINEPQLIDEILRNCLRANLIPEINTSTLRNKMAEPMPGKDTVQRYADLGGTCMSLGSDAHSPQYVGENFDDAVGIMRSAGIKHLAVFRDGEMKPVDVD